MKPSRSVLGGSSWQLFTDGGSRGNPGPAGAGFVLTNLSGAVIEKGGKFIGSATNNVAEYSALIFGLEAALKLGGSQLVCYSDSELIVRQINGQYKVKDAVLKSYYLKVKNLVGKFKRVLFVSVPREKNRRADKLVNEAIDRTTKKILL